MRTPADSVRRLDRTQANRLALRSLRRQWLMAAGLAAPALGAVYALLAQTAFEPSAERWLVLAILVATTVLGITWQVLPRNHRPGEDEIFARFGAGTWLTLLSGLLLAYVAGFLFSPWPGGWLAWLPALLYLASRIVDLFDGYLARMSDHVTDAGGALDIELDGLGLLIAVGLGVWYGQLPAWYLILAVSRQLFVAGIWWRTHRDKPVYQLPPSDNRRIIAGCQTGFIAIVLWPVLSPPATMLAAVLFAIPLVASFGRDWLVVSGVIDADSAAYHLWRNRIKRVVEWWLPFAARVAGALAGATMLARAAPQFTTWEVYLYATGMQNIRLAPWLIALVFAASLVLFALGIAGRVASLFVIGLAVLDMQASGLLWTGNALLMACGILVLHVGSGCCALWQPEEPFLHRRLGQPGPALR